MRETWPKQLPLMPQIKYHPQNKALEVTIDIIDDNPTIFERILQDLNKGKQIACRKGAERTRADHVLRCAIVKNLFCFTDQDLSFHIIILRAPISMCSL